MSFEGYWELLCPAKHEWAHDVYDAEPKVCPECGRAWEKRRLIDQTNHPTVKGRWHKLRQGPKP